MKTQTYLLDTHALVFWATRTEVSDKFIEFFDNQEKGGSLFVSSITFWEIALLSEKGKIQISDVRRWRAELFQNTKLWEVDPDASSMMASVRLPTIHKDPFDRLLIAQAQRLEALLVTKDQRIRKYPVETFWM